MSNPNIVPAVRRALSAARLRTFEIASAAKGNDDPVALDLYAWNAKVSGALLIPLHICEVVVRNAIAEAIEQVYGAGWPWSPGFLQSLPDPLREWSPRKEIVAARRSYRSAGKVIPELKFVFWQTLMTQRHDSRLWAPFLYRVFPNLDPRVPVARWRQDIFQELRGLRELRNRIAHHEPILTRDLSSDYQRMVRLVDHRCRITADWMGEICGEIPRLIDGNPCRRPQP